jgi:hypothetical protein
MDPFLWSLNAARMGSGCMNSSFIMSFQVIVHNRKQGQRCYLIIKGVVENGCRRQQTRKKKFLGWNLVGQNSGRNSLCDVPD